MLILPIQDPSNIPHQLHVVLVSRGRADCPSRYHDIDNNGENNKIKSSINHGKAHRKANFDRRKIESSE